MNHHHLLFPVLKNAKSFFFPTCVLPKWFRRTSLSLPVRKSDVGETVSLPAVSGQQRVDASGGKAVKKVFFFFLEKASQV